MEWSASDLQGVDLTFTNLLGNGLSRQRSGVGLWLPVVDLPAALSERIRNVWRLGVGRPVSPGSP